MKGEGEIERWLAQVPVPTLREGPHRERLKQQLLDRAQSSLPGGEKTGVSLFHRMSPLMKLAAALLVAAILAVTGWAAERIYKKLTRVWVTLDESPIRMLPMPDGSTGGGKTAFHTVVSSEVPNAIEAAKRRHEEMKQLIAQKKYGSVKTFEHLGQTQYAYKFTLSNGDFYVTNFSMPLENVTSWDDYLQKDGERLKKRQERINKAVAAGNFRLIDVDVIRVHICRDVGSDQKIRVQRLAGRDGKDIAVVRPFKPETLAQLTTQPQTSWQEHLEAVRDGQRELLSLETTKLYDYEVVLEDGSKTIFQYGEPLKKPETK